MEKQLLQFINDKFNVPNVGDTPENKGQCVGLIEVWLDILGLNSPHLYGNAKDLLVNAEPSKFDIIYNTPDNFPVYGDVLVYDKSWGNGLGHCGVILRANVYTFTLFEANNPTGKTPTIRTQGNYGGVAGWLHPKI